MCGPAKCSKPIDGEILFCGSCPPWKCTNMVAHTLWMIVLHSCVANNIQSQWHRLHRALGHGHMPPPHFYKWMGTGEHREYKNSKQETDQTVLTITKALTKTTNCTYIAKKSGGTTNKKFPALAPDRCIPHFQIRSGATYCQCCVRV